MEATDPARMKRDLNHADEQELLNHKGLAWALLGVVVFLRFYHTFLALQKLI